MHLVVLIPKQLGMHLPLLQLISEKNKEINFAVIQLLMKIRTRESAVLSVLFNVNYFQSNKQFRVKEKALQCREELCEYSVKVGA